MASLTEIQAQDIIDKAYTRLSEVLSSKSPTIKVAEYTVDYNDYIRVLGNIIKDQQTLLLAIPAEEINYGVMG